MENSHCVKSVQIWSCFWSVFSQNTGKYGPEITPYLHKFHVVSRNHHVDHFLHHYTFTEGYPETSRTPIFAKRSIIDVSLDSKYASAFKFCFEV